MGILLVKNKLPKFTLDEIKKHNSKNDCWIIVKKKVYDITDFINIHPIGYTPIIKKAGSDCTYDLSFHSKNARKILSQYLIGKLK